MRRPSLPVSVLSVALLAACNPAADTVAPESQASFAASPNANAVHRYEVVVTNLTTGQPFSRPVAVTHTNAVSLFEIGQAASAGIRDIAERGATTTAEAALTGLPGVFDLVISRTPVDRIGGTAFPTSLRFEITAAANANYLSLATMLVCTNDGFTGLNAVRLPHGSKPETYYAAAYDAGTEVNDEASATVVGGCFTRGPVAGSGGTGRVAEEGVVRMHPGILGGGVLTAAHAWTGPVARITIQRLK